MHSTCTRPRGSTAPSRQHPHRANLSPTSRALLACHPALSLNASPVMCLSICPLLRITTIYPLACSATRRRGRYMCWLRHAITTFIRRYPSPGSRETCARAYRFTFRPAGTFQCATRSIDAATGLLRFQGIGRMCSRLGRGNRGEYPNFQLCPPSLPSCPTTCACHSLLLSSVASGAGMYLRCFTRHTFF